MHGNYHFLKMFPVFNVYAPPILMDSNLYLDKSTKSKIGLYSYEAHYVPGKCFWINKIAKLFAEVLYPNRDWVYQENKRTHGVSYSAKMNNFTLDVLIADLTRYTDPFINAAQMDLILSNPDIDIEDLDLDIDEWHSTGMYKKFSYYGRHGRIK